MMANMHPNEVLLREGYEAYERGDAERVLSLMADGIEWRVEGNGPLAGHYVGKEAVVAFFTQKMELSGGTFTEREHDVLATTGTSWA